MTASIKERIALFPLLLRRANGYAVVALTRTTKITAKIVIIALRPIAERIPAFVIAFFMFSNVKFLKGNDQ